MVLYLCHPTDLVLALGLEAQSLVHYVCSMVRVFIIIYILSWVIDVQQPVTQLS